MLNNFKNKPKNTQRISRRNLINVRNIHIISNESCNKDAISFMWPKQNKTKQKKKPTNKPTIAGSLQAKLIFSVINRIRLMFSYCAAGFIIAASKRLMFSLNYTHVWISKEFWCVVINLIYTSYYERASLVRMKVDIIACVVFLLQIFHIFNLFWL